MKKETPRSLKREAGLANGLMTVALDAGCLPRGEDIGKAQSERAKRVLRHIDLRVASSARPFGTGSRHQMGQKRRLGSGQQDRWRHRDSLTAARRRGCRPMPSAQALTSQQEQLTSQGDRSLNIDRGAMK